MEQDSYFFIDITYNSYNYESIKHPISLYFACVLVFLHMVFIWDQECRILFTEEIDCEHKI